MPIYNLPDPISVSRPKPQASVGPRSVGAIPQRPLACVALAKQALRLCGKSRRSSEHSQSPKAVARMGGGRSEGVKVNESGKLEPDALARRPYQRGVRPKDG